MVVLTIAIAAVYSLGIQNPVAWATVASAMAVVTAIFSTWSAQRVVELQEDANEPYVHPTFDLYSRYGLIQICVTNYGGSMARDVRLKWAKPVRDSKGNMIRFVDQDGVPDIAVLQAKERISVLVDSSTQLFKSTEELEYEGQIEYKSASGRRRTHQFYLNLDMYRKSLTFADEAPKTQHELQKIPKALDSIESELHRIRLAMNVDVADGIHSLSDTSLSQVVTAPGESEPKI